MKPHPRIRRTIKWGGLGASLLLIAVWVASGSTSVMWRSSGYGVGVVSGQLRLTRVHAGVPWGDPIGLHCQSTIRTRWLLWFRWYPGSGADTLDIPIWSLAAAVLLAGGGAWFLDVCARRRERAGRCPKCRYDRTGLAAGVVCPECGATVTGPEGR
jgi:hypothetical protein